MTTGMGTVLVFGTPQHTMYLYHGIMGIHQGAGVGVFGEINHPCAP